MKKNFKKLVLNKSTLSNLDASKVSGGDKPSNQFGVCDTWHLPSELKTACVKKSVDQKCYAVPPSQGMKRCVNSKHTFCGPAAC